MPPLAIVAGVAAAGMIGSSLIKAGAERDASEKQQDAYRRANDTQYSMWAQSRDDQMPWRDAGLSALHGMQDPEFQKNFTMGDFSQDPGYQFRMDQGQKALERSAAARGGLQSGGTLKGAADYSQNFASNEFNNAYNRFNNDRNQRFSRLGQIAGIGQGATNQMGQYNQNYGNNSGQITMASGNAAAASRVAQGQIYGNMTQGLSQLPMNMYGGGMMGSGGMGGGASSVGGGMMGGGMGKTGATPGMYS